MTVPSVGKLVFVFWLPCWAGSYLHLVICFHLSYFLASSSTYLFEKIKKIHYLGLFSVMDQKGPFARNGICSCLFSEFQSGWFSCYTSNFTWHLYSVLWSGCFPLHTRQYPPFSTPSPILFILQYSLYVPPLWDASLEYLRVVVPECLGCLYQKKSWKQVLWNYTEMVISHPHYFLKEITFWHKKAGGTWCQVKDSFKNWFKYLYMENTLCCPLVSTSFAGAWKESYCRLSTGNWPTWPYPIVRTSACKPTHPTAFCFTNYVAPSHVWLFTFTFYYVLSPWLVCKLLKSDYKYVAYS